MVVFLASSPETAKRFEVHFRRHTVKTRLFLVLWAATLHLSLAQPSSAQVFFTMDFSQAAYPNAGWGGIESGPLWEPTHVPGGGPNRQDAIQLRQIPCPTCRDWGGQFNWGWRGEIESNPAQGVTRYYRWRMKFSSDTNFKALSGGNGLPRNMDNKLLLVGQGCATPRCRVILTYRSDKDNRRLQYFRIQLGGGDDLADTPPYDIDQWFDVQVELRSSTTLASADGSYRIWINNNEYSNPTAVRSGFVLHSDNWGYVWFGGFQNDGLEEDGIHTWLASDFVAARSFDSEWHRMPGTVSPGAPQNVRIVQ